jgi:uncharacterized protein YdaT
MQVWKAGNSMPWTHSTYPPSLKNLDESIRDKAVDIANALLEDGYVEGRALAIGTAQAKRWGSRHRDEDHRQARDYQVVHHPQGWVVRRSNSQSAASVHATKKEARERAILYARHEGVRVVVHLENGQVEDVIAPRERS